jgi:hypothetical protein
MSDNVILAAENHRKAIFMNIPAAFAMTRPNFSIERAGARALIKVGLNCSIEI